MEKQEQSVKEESENDETEVEVINAEEESDEVDDDEQEETPEVVEVTRGEIEELKQQSEEFREKYFRRTADLDNLRKRFKREKEQYQKYANYELLRDLLEILDNFERARDTMEFENEEVREGMQMIDNQLRGLLEKYDVEPVDAEGEPFDPQEHEGMMREEREDLDRQVVLEVFKKGYKLHDRILRPASVKVGIPVKSSSEQDDETEQE